VEVRQDGSRDDEGDHECECCTDGIANLQLDRADIDRQSTDGILDIRAQQDKERRHQARNDRLEEVLDCSADKDTHRKR